jgi:hypothetical protein
VESYKANAGLLNKTNTGLEEWLEMNHQARQLKLDHAKKMGG